MALCLLAAQSCAYRAYQPGQIVDLGGARVGCLEVRVAPYARTPRPSVVPVEIDVGNACGRPVPIDLGRVVVTYADRTGARALSLVDPAHEMHRRVLDAAATGATILAFASNGRALTAGRACIDVSNAIDPFVPVTCFDWRPPEGRSP